MPPQENREDLLFSASNRTFNAEDEITLTSVGIDIGSSTSHLVFSRILMERRDAVYVVKSRELIFESKLLLTPYLEGADIHAAALEQFFDTQYRHANLTLEDIDAGAVILTGVAARRRNARAIGDLFAQSAGKFVALSAGDRLETTLVAHGSGAVQLSAREKLRVMHVDIGGGTAKIAVCVHGGIVDRTVIDVGARLLAFDPDERVTVLEDAGRMFAVETGCDAGIGTILPAEARQAIVERMADCLLQAMGATPLENGARRYLRLAPLDPGPPPDVVSFSGGVSEYLYNKESASFGDLGPMLAAAVLRRVRSWGVAIREPIAGIRATVIGASQYTVQLSGSTIFVTPLSAVPLRNVTVVRPRLELDVEELDMAAVAGAIRGAIEELDLADGKHPVAIFVSWQGSATYRRLDAFCRGLLQGLESVMSRGQPLVLATDADVGGLLGMHLQHECGLEIPIVSVDGLSLSELDFIDIGALLAASGAVPVVIKSLVFPHRHANLRSDRA